MGQLSGIKIAAPTYNDVVPSTKAKVKLTPFRVGDEKTLLIASESKNTGQMIGALKEVIRNCVSPVDVDALAPFDLEYLFIKLRAVSVGEVAKIGLKCDKCETQNIVEINLDKVKVSETSGHTNTIKVTPELVFEMRYPDVEVLAELSSGDTSIETTFDLVARCVTKVFHSGDVIEVGPGDIDDLKEILNQLSSTTFMEVQKFFETSPKLVEEVKFKCSHCGTDNKQRLEGLASFF